ncbi:hypothetical protein R6Q57_012751 [Mikania cordata]
MERTRRIVTNHAAKAGGQRDYKCRACTKRFDTFQALGGHQGVHKKVDETFVGLSLGGPKSSGRMHRCKMCGKVFRTGPALGGHMTRHRLRKDLVPMVVGQRQKAAESRVTVDRIQLLKVEEDDGCDDVRKELILAAKEWRLYTCVNDF